MRTQFRDDQLNFGSGSGINANDIPETSARKWLSTDLQEINGEKVFKDPVQVSGSIFSTGDIEGTDIQIRGNVYVNHNGPNGDGRIYFYNDSDPSGEFFGWDDSASHFVLTGDFINSGYIWSQDNIVADRDMYINYSGLGNDSYLYFYDGGSTTGQSLMWDDDPGEFVFSSQLSMGSSKIVDVSDPTNDQDAATKAYVDTEVGSVTLDNVCDNGNTTDQVVTVETLQSNKDIYVNHDGGDGDSRIYFYDGGFSTGQSLMWDDSASEFKFSAQLSMGSNKIVDVTDPTSNQDAATKKYVDNNTDLSCVSGSAPRGTTSIGALSVTDTGVSVDLTDGMWVVHYMGYVYVDPDRATDWVDFWVEDGAGNGIDHSGQRLTQFNGDGFAIDRVLHNQFIVFHRGAASTYTLKAVRSANCRADLKGDAPDGHDGSRTNMIAIRVADNV